MQSFFAEYGLFVLEALTVLAMLLVATLFVAGSIARLRRSGGGRSGRHGQDDGRIEIVRYNERLEGIEEALAEALLDPGARRVAEKARRARDKAEAKAAAKAAKAEARLLKRRLGKNEKPPPDDSAPRRVFVLDFDGDIRASQVEKLRREITAVLTGATAADEIVVRLESGGGAVTGYGLAASQLDRIRKRRIPLTICVDKVAASGGYMMACVADRLVAAPFAMLGSIGVIAQLPNFHRLLKELNIDVEILTAGKYKRTLTLLGENTDEGRRKLLQDIERIHGQFKDYVAEHRPRLDVERVSTGEIWSGDDALELHLVDEIRTSDEYLVAAAEEREVLLVGYTAPKKGLMSRFSSELEEGADRLLLRWYDRLVGQRHP